MRRGRGAFLRASGGDFPPSRFASSSSPPRNIPNRRAGGQRGRDGFHHNVDCNGKRKLVLRLVLSFKEKVVFPLLPSPGRGLRLLLQSRSLQFLTQDVTHQELRWLTFCFCLRRYHGRRRNLRKIKKIKPYPKPNPNPTEYVADYTISRPREGSGSRCASIACGREI